MRKDGQRSTGYWAAEYACWRSGGLSQRAYCQGRGYSLYRFKNGISTGKKLGLIPNVRDEKRSKLVQLIVEAKSGRPNDGAVYVFRNRQRNKVKLLLWHHNGFFLGYKRLERGKFDFPTDADVVEVDAEALRELMLGMPMVYKGKGQAEKLVFS